MVHSLRQNTLGRQLYCLHRCGIAACNLSGPFNSNTLRQIADHRRQKQFAEDIRLLPSTCGAPCVRSLQPTFAVPRSLSPRSLRVCTKADHFLFAKDNGVVLIETVRLHALAQFGQPSGFA
jgi:hypothetical protein